MAHPIVSKTVVATELVRVAAMFPDSPDDEIHTLVAASLGVPVESVREVAQEHEGVSQ